METLAEARSVPLKELAAAVDENANRVFAIA
jgi:Tat protein secretion system quality control protein TatD with DNase activity